MAADATVEGLRELKKRRTRRDIVVATLELSLESGYRATTIPMIAERAMVSPRTVSTYFPNKDEIPFDGADEVLDGLAARLAEEDRPLIERLRLWIADRDPEQHDDELEVLRRRAIIEDSDLRLIEHRYLDRFAEVIAAAVAEELGAAPGDPGPQTFAAAFLGVLLSLRNRLDEEKRKKKPEEALEAGFKFLEAGLGALR
ncbi:MAG: TetR/AcrR family transcriptional regulator [Actinobacteria bacterium]|nr:TetR/AcrR family transcriptional regulator [Actinomycetota bacterium]